MKFMYGFRSFPLYIFVFECLVQKKLSLELRFRPALFVVQYQLALPKMTVYNSSNYVYPHLTGFSRNENASHAIVNFVMKKDL